MEVGFIMSICAFPWKNESANRPNLRGGWECGLAEISQEKGSMFWKTYSHLCPHKGLCKGVLLWAARFLSDQSNGEVQHDTAVKTGLLTRNSLYQIVDTWRELTEAFVGSAEITVEAFHKFWNVGGSRVEGDSSWLKGMRLFHCPRPVQPTGLAYWWRTREHPFVRWKPADSCALNLLSSLSTVTLSAAPPSYFRGFTLIALKENREGDKEEDHAGTFQVRPLWAPPQPPCPRGWKPGERWADWGA